MVECGVGLISSQSIPVSPFLYCRGRALKEMIMTHSNVLSQFTIWIDQCFTSVVGTRRQPSMSEFSHVFLRWMCLWVDRCYMVFPSYILYCCCISSIFIHHKFFCCSFSASNFYSRAVVIWMTVVVYINCDWYDDDVGVD